MPDGTSTDCRLSARISADDARYGKNGQSMRISFGGISLEKSVYCSRKWLLIKAVVRIRNLVCRGRFPVACPGRWGIGYVVRLFPLNAMRRTAPLTPPLA